MATSGRRLRSERAAGHPDKRRQCPPRPEHIWDVNPGALGHTDFFTLWELMKEEHNKRKDIEMEEAEAGSKYGDLSGGSSSLL